MPEFTVPDPITGEDISTSDFEGERTITVVITSKAPIQRSRLRSFCRGIRIRGAGCVTPVFLAVVARTITLPTEAAMLVLGVYAGVVAVLMAATTVATGVGIISNANRVMAHARRLKRLAGVVMIVAGINQLYISVIVY
jgi:cytochrome c biogenesis protein CcdA